MITSNQINRLIENYVASGIAQGQHVEIFENPSKSDFLTMAKTVRENGRTLQDIRFIADAKTQKVYVADAHNITHPWMYITLKRAPINFRDTPWVFDGTASVSGDVAKATGWCKWDDIVPQYSSQDLAPRDKIWIENTFKQNWSFANNYIAGLTDMIDRYKIKFNKAYGKG